MENESLQSISSDLLNKRFSEPDQNQIEARKKLKEEIYNIIKESWTSGTSFARSEKRDGVILGMKINQESLVEAVNKIFEVLK